MKQPTNNNDKTEHHKESDRDAEDEDGDNDEDEDYDEDNESSEGESEDVKGEDQDVDDEGEDVERNLSAPIITKKEVSTRNRPNSWRAMGKSFDAGWTPEEIHFHTFGAPLDPTPSAKANFLRQLKKYAAERNLPEKARQTKSVVGPVVEADLFKLICGQFLKYGLVSVYVAKSMLMYLLKKHKMEHLM